MNYVGTGGFRLRGYANTIATQNVVFAYAPGQTLYIAQRANRGVLEAVTIKKIVPVSNARTGGVLVPMYKDMLNALFNESDLVSEAGAIALATAYYQSRLGWAQQALLQGLSPPTSESADLNDDDDG